jgi:predicted N-formylglutamate amidohydrolase
LTSKNTMNTLTGFLRRHATLHGLLRLVLHGRERAARPSPAYLPHRQAVAHFYGLIVLTLEAECGGRGSVRAVHAGTPVAANDRRPFSTPTRS